MGNRAFFQLWCVLALILLPLEASSSAATTPSGAQVSGVVYANDGRPIAGARILIGDHLLVSDAQGTIPLTTLPLDDLRAEVDVTVTAAGYAAWRYVGVELSAAHPVELRIVLGQQPVLIAPQSDVGTAAVADMPPDFINVGRTLSTTCVYPPTNVQRVDRMPFMDYVRNVLPNEWIASWPAASLDAGAVAVSQYAWSVAFAQRKWTRYGYPFDVLDSTCDQVYKDREPLRNYAATDTAVARMWGTALLRNAALFTTFYRAYDEQCGTNLDCMSQYGTRDLAVQGRSGAEILQYYYSRRAPFVAAATAPAQRALVLRRSPDVVIWPDHPATLTLCLRNAGTTSWQSGLTDLGVVDPLDPINTSYASPLADPSWISPQRPATLTESSVALGENGRWSFTVSASPALEPGTYELAVSPIQADDTTWIATDTPIRWTVSVQPPTTLTARTWLPVVSGPASAPLCP